VKKHAAFKWKDAISGFPVSPGSAEALVGRGGKIKYILIAYFLGNICAKNCHNRTVYIKIIAICKSGTFFWDTVYISHLLRWTAQLALTELWFYIPLDTKCTTTQNKFLKLKPGLDAAYDIRPGNGEGLFWFWCFINLSLSYLDTYPLTYSPGTHTVWQTGKSSLCSVSAFFYQHNN